MITPFCIFTSFAFVIAFVDASNDDISVLILSQASDWDAQRANAAKDRLLLVSESLDSKLNVFLSHADFEDTHGHWTVWTLLPRLVAQLKESPPKWLLVCEPDTEVDLKRLLELLSKYDSSEKRFFGKALYDRSPTIIHHYYGAGENQERNFAYPDFAGGVVLSWEAVTSLALALEKRTRGDFAIDPKHELAILLKNAGISMENVSSFCTTNVEDESCITKYLPSYSNCGHEVSENDVYFAVKTFSGYHKDRIVVVKRTWSKSANHIEYFSDIEDHFVPTVNIGIENTERGHCGKTFAIFKRFLEHEELQSLDLAWLAVVDDDTLLSVPRLFKLLSCYDSSKPLIVGERYGYGFTTEGQGGYDYPTGGSGMFFTRPAVQAIIDSCQCPSNDAPDDMIIGMCARRQEIPVLHSAAFHQARPDDYAEDYLNRLPPISFHKHTDVDPYKVYTDYLVERETEPEVHHHRHTEL